MQRRDVPAGSSAIEPGGRLIAAVAIGLMLCFAVVAAMFDVDAAMPMIGVTVAFGLAVLCGLVWKASATKDSPIPTGKAGERTWLARPRVCQVV